MGTVYEAVREDDQFEKRVAIKLLAVGVDKAAEERFRNERQILASLVHPNIALLLDGGSTTDGQPYLVIERIEGVPVTEYAASTELSVEQRLELFGKICGAVQYAHQNLVVHRDLKPANILVTADGAPKLLDFGIAKLIDAESDTAATGVRMLTPDYASPEQLRGDPVTTATDIYLLGLLLYELLTTQNPHQLMASRGAGMERVVCEINLPPPSTVVDPRWRRSVEGDVDTIILKALRKEPERRYGSVESLWGDIRRHLDGMPITARQDTLFYRSSKLVRRHRLAFGTAALVLLTLVGGAVVSAREASLAERRFQQVRRLTNAFLFDFHDKIQGLPGSMETRQVVVKTALDYLSSLRADAAGDESLEWDIAVAYERVGDAQGYPFTSNLGQTSAALDSYRRALAIKERLSAKTTDPERIRSLAQTYHRLADLQAETGDTRGATESMRRWSAASGRAPASSAEDHRILGSGYSRLGQIRSMGGDVPGMLEAFRRSCDHLEKLRELRPDGNSYNLLAFCYQRLGYGHIWWGDVSASLPLYRRAIDLGRKAVSAEPLNTAYRRNLTLSIISLGDVLGSPFHINLGDTHGAEAAYQEALQSSVIMTEADPKNAQSQVMLNNTRVRLATTLLHRDPRKALAMYLEALRGIDRLVDAEPRNTVFRRDRGFTLLDIAAAYEQLDERAAALRALRQCLDQQEAIVFADSARTQFRQDMIPTHLALSRILQADGKADEALRHVQLALDLAEAQRQASPHNLYTMRNLSDSFEAMGALSGPGARQWLEKNAALWAEWESSHPVSPYSTQRRRRAVQLLDSPQPAPAAAPSRS
jgi:tetratricopeptide (TPR) repeat protein